MRKIIVVVILVLFWMLFLRLSSSFAVKHIDNIFAGSTFIVVCSLLYGTFLLKVFEVFIAEREEPEKRHLISNHGDIELENN